MIPVVYYAHSMKSYDTEQEQNELETIQNFFSDALIFNPNRQSIQRAKEPMRECLYMVKDESIQSLVFSCHHGYIESGVYAEIQSARKQGKSVYLLIGDEVKEFSGEFKRSRRKDVLYYPVNMDKEI